MYACFLPNVSALSSSAGMQGLHSQVTFAIVVPPLELPLLETTSGKHLGSVMSENGLQGGIEQDWQVMDVTYRMNRFLASERDCRDEVHALRRWY